MEPDLYKRISNYIDIDSVKEKFWKDNPTLPEHIVDSVVQQNIKASFEYHLYHTFNDEAS